MRSMCGDAPALRFARSPSGASGRLHVALVAALAAAMATGADARAQGNREGPRATVQLDGSERYAGLPFDLLVSATGFEEQPEPQAASFDIPGCKVTQMGISPNVSTSITILNGQRTESRRVEFVFRFRVEASAAGRYKVPAIKVTQGRLEASTQPGTVEVSELETSREMRLQLTLPERPVSVGETFDVTLDWYLRRDPGDQHFVVPLFDATDWVEVRAPAGAAPQAGFGRRKQALAFTAGDRDIELPYTSDTATLDGVEYSRFRFKATVTPIKPGTLAVLPARVVASFRAGVTRDRFGFPSPRMQLYKVEDVARTLVIKPLPMKDRPPSFAGAVGTALSIQVQASRTVVKLGEPIELEILIRGDARMEGLGLPPLDNPDGLPADRFIIADAPAAGELVRDPDSGEVKGKRFRVTVRIKSPEVREIPSLAFSYYNPATGAYETAHSQPIALSVAGSAIVGAGDVVSGHRQEDSTSNGAAGKAEPRQTGAGARGTSGGASVVADLSLSQPGETLRTTFSMATILPLEIALYAGPLILLGLVLWLRRTREQRDRASEIRHARRAVERALAQAADQPARQAAPALLAALRKLAGVTGQSSIRGEEVIVTIESVSYDPRLADQPIDRDLIARAEKLTKKWLAESRMERREGGAAAVLLCLLGGLGAGILPGRALAGTEPASAAADAAVTVEAARSAYQTALAEPDRDARALEFSAAERMFRQLVESTPDRPELLTDWGNAALGSNDLGRAILAYRRALALDPSLERAERNLSWARNRMPGWLPHPHRAGTADLLFFWNRPLTRAGRHALAALAFALAVLVFILGPWPWPWPRSWSSLRDQTWPRWLAIAPALVWLAVTASILVDRPPVADAVVVRDAVPLLSADSQGAPLALSDPLPAGAEVTILERRGAFTRISLASGQKGWIEASAAAPVLAAPE